MTFYYYQGDWIKGKILLQIIEAETITIADKIFEEKTNINPIKNKEITVTLRKFFKNQYEQTTDERMYWLEQSILSGQNPDGGL